MTFENGKSGNPHGRPSGIPDKRTKLRKLITTSRTRVNPKSC